jgi:putative flavoprotein involved in K+ transport
MSVVRHRRFADAGAVGRPRRVPVLAAFLHRGGRRTVRAMHIDTVVIGAGQAGLGISHELAARGVDHVVLERGRIGESWRSQRWDSFTLNSPAWINVMPGDAPPEHPDGFPTAAEFALGLQRYAFRHRLPVREEVEVLDVEIGARGARLRVVTDEDAIEARSVIVASGTSKPRIPPVALSLSAFQLHAAGYRNADHLPAGRVLVVGGGQSGIQIADELLDAGRDVLLSTSKAGRVPRRYRGRDVFAWLDEEGFLDERRGDAAAGPNPQLGAAYTVSYQQLEQRGAVLLGGLERADRSRVQFRGDLGHHIVFADAVSAAIRTRIDAHIERTGTDAPSAEDDPADEPYRAGLLPAGSCTLDLRGAGVSAVIWATGFDAATRFLPHDVTGERGALSHHDGATAVPGLFVLGHPWLRTRRSGTISGIAADAPHVADLVVDHLATRRQAA